MKKKKFILSILAFHFALFAINLYICLYSPVWNGYAFISVIFNGFFAVWRYREIWRARRFFIPDR